MTTIGHDTLGTAKKLKVKDKQYTYYSIKEAEKHLGDLSRLPFSMKVLLENLLRFEDDRSVYVDDVNAIGEWLRNGGYVDREISYRPARVLMQDFTGVPAVVDLAAMRDATKELNADPQKVNPLCPVDLVIDHSVMVDYFGAEDSREKNEALEFERNAERYEFLRWGQKSFDNFRVVPPGTGICHQVNVECLARCVWSSENRNNVGEEIAYPDTCVGTDSHTTMVNGMGVLGWGVGGIEAEAAMLGQPVTMLIPEVIGFKLEGKLREGCTATDLVLTITQMLREKGVVGKFVEYYGSGLKNLSLPDRSTIANMAPEYGATCGIFPIDEETIRYLVFTGRAPQYVALAEDYAKEQGMWWQEGVEDPVFTDTLYLDMGTVEPSLAGPKRPQDRVTLANMAKEHKVFLAENGGGDRSVPVDNADYTLDDGDVVLTAITSCTNTSNPDVLVAAGLIARKARALGIKSKPWVKTSFAPGSQVVSDYMEAANLQEDLDYIGFNLVGYGCTTCIGNSGPLPDNITKAIEENDMLVNAVLSGNRNFEGRVSPHTRGNFLASPPLVVIYALAGNVKIDIMNDPITQDQNGNNVYLKDLWPSNTEIRETVEDNITPEMFKARYADVSRGPKAWQDIDVEATETYTWNPSSTYIQNPPYFEGMTLANDAEVTDIMGAKSLLTLADSITTDHISPAGSFKADTPAGTYLMERQVAIKDFNSYGSRRGNHEIMMRGTFANIRIRNELAPGTEGGFTTKDGKVTTVYQAAMEYKDQGVPLVVFGGKEYGTGSSRDWAAKGTNLLGIKAVIVESFERIHRSNLVGMGVLPLMFKDGITRADLNLKGDETFDILGIAGEKLQPKMDVTLNVNYSDGTAKEVILLCRIDTIDELEYFRNGGILNYVLRSMLAA